ncbi:acyl-CoA thioesterase [Vicingaceae bacterium]|nr:acyl-CoA thioesterase [Vicingaceae bacterium]
MIKSKTTLRVRYSETDQMGFVYYGNYPQYLEIGRVDALKSVGISYRSMEESGYGLPVKYLVIRYHNAALYDDELVITTHVINMPTNKITFDYEIYRGEDLIITAQTTLFFVDASKRACRPPVDFREKMKAYFN